ncbi:hypothetical protein CYJ33_06615 [Alloscardovia omnicolens]|nr:hypothetical protein CYJ33_06615 [Alloscardovia omnicolens]
MDEDVWAGLVHVTLIVVWLSYFVCLTSERCDGVDAVFVAYRDERANDDACVGGVGNDEEVWMWADCAASRVLVDVAFAYADGSVAFEDCLACGVHDGVLSVERVWL